MTPPLGVYIHIPFCARRCPYCDFAIAVRKNIPHEAYANALCAELQARSPHFASASPRLRSIFVGGGTPSLLDVSALGRVLDAVRERFAAESESLEISLEANPNDLEREGFQRLRAVGVNRLSLGVQSFSTEILSFLGREHSGERAIRAVEDAREAGITRISVDLIFGSAPQSLEAFERDLETVRRLGVGHVSTYNLTIEEHTPFGRRAERGETLLADEDRSVEMHEAADRVLEGFVRYEISSLSQPDERCQHNLLYWRGGDYLGLGMGAHSCRRLPGGGAVRRGNDRNIKRYLETPWDHVALHEALDATTHLAERLFLGLRTRLDVDLERLEQEHPEGSMELFEPVIQAFVERGWVSREGRVVSSTRQGLLFHDSMTRALLEVLPDQAS